MPYLVAAGHLLMAVLLGALIGVERQRRQRMAGLRTNALVSLGAAAFVMLGVMVEGELSPTRVASQVVSGIGFLCAGVIMRDGFNVRGLNTAATLWCAAAVGVLAGSGFVIHATLVTFVVLLAHFTLRPLAGWINRQPLDEQTEVESHYRLRIVVRRDDEAHIRALLMHIVNNGPLLLRGLHSADGDGGDKVRVEAELSGTGKNNDFLEQAVARLSLEGVVSEVSWSLLPIDEARNDRGVGLFGR
ncbi:hypothetical protein CAI21_16160 [Alkalilimnicola ehrlichii]|nr:hypothetical protein CAI21_16160 [Alkalilimnicola ehrlichii]